MLMLKNELQKGIRLLVSKVEKSISFIFRVSPWKETYSTDMYGLALPNTEIVNEI